jgi:hypothetical protein
MDTGIRVGSSMPPDSVLAALGQQKKPPPNPPPPLTTGKTPPPGFFKPFQTSYKSEDEGEDEGGDEGADEGEDEGEDEGDGFSDEDNDEESEDPEESARRMVLLEEQKSAMIARISKIKTSHKIAGPVLTRMSSVEDVRFELHRLEDEVVLRQSVKVQRRVLMAVASGLEFAHHKTPASGKLSGWSETIMANIDSYDDVFDRLHRKHAPKLGFGKGRRNEPELELAMMVSYSAFSFALTNTMMQLGKPAVPPPTKRPDFSLSDYSARKKEMGFEEEEKKMNRSEPRVVTFGKK